MAVGFSTRTDLVLASTSIPSETEDKNENEMIWYRPRSKTNAVLQAEVPQSPSTVAAPRLIVQAF